MPWTKGKKLQGGKYVIEKVLGEGGFGITYKALDDEENPVVIKTPKEYLTDDPNYDNYIKRFVKEGRILEDLSRVSHPHIVGVIERFKEDDTHCLVMDFVDGENLFEVVKRRGALPEAEIVPCIRQIGEALMVVHTTAGLVHRDAHPGNIMLQSTSKAVLIDFGIAKDIVPTSLTTRGYTGNDSFAPYEQKYDGSREPTVDVYCLAATLYYALTGRSPTTSLARKLYNASLTPPEEIISGISDQLNDAIIEGMALEAKDRPQSMQAWLAMLEAPKAMPPPPVEPDYTIEVVGPTTNPESEATPDRPATKSPKIIPWGWLVGVLLGYLSMGYLSARYNATYIVSAVAWAWALAWAWSWARAVAWVVAAAVVVVGVTTGIVAGATVVALVLALGVVAWFWAWAVATDELQKSFSKFHTFLILASTSSLSLGLGRLVRWLFTGS
jgi:serine/threonine-protein kinase